MFNSGISAKELVEELISEVDIALNIPNATYISWLNSLQQLLYTEVIKEQKKIILHTSKQSPISISSIVVGNDENSLRFEDIHAIYADGVQLIKTTLASGAIFPNSFYKDNNNIGFYTKSTPNIITIVYIVKPALIKVSNNDVINDTNVMVPVEFIDLVKAKLRGEAYKLANEDALASKWLNDYNILLETFKSWINEKSAIFGL